MCARLIYLLSGLRDDPDFIPLVLHPLQQQPGPERQIHPAGEVETHHLGIPTRWGPALGAGRCLKVPAKSPGKALCGVRRWDVWRVFPFPALLAVVHFQAGQSGRCSEEEQFHTFTENRQGLRHAPGLGGADRFARGHKEPLRTKMERKAQQKSQH